MKNDRELRRIVAEIREMLDEIGSHLRRTYLTTAAVGERLLIAKGKLRHGAWMTWLADNFEMSGNTARYYIRVHRQAKEEPVPDRQMSTAQFVRRHKDARIAARRDAHDEERARVAALAGKDPGRFVVHAADCRTFAWPEDIDVIATDPPWMEMDAYRWLGGFAEQHLREGGWLLVQAGHKNLHKVAAILDRRLSYIHTFAIVFKSSDTHLASPFSLNWRPVLVFSKGKPSMTGMTRLSDAFTAKSYSKKYHDWQQPVEPWEYWLSAFSSPGDVVADPFAGSATVGVAVKRLGGGRKYIGTEIDPGHARVAQGRINETEEGAGLDLTKPSPRLTIAAEPIEGLDRAAYG